jgi:Flp pilus assembly protein TadG
MLFRRLLHDRSGVSAVQFAFVAPLLILMTLGIIDMGRLGLTISTLRNAAIETSRYASMHGADSPSPASETAIINFAKDRAVGIPKADLSVAVAWLPDGKSGSEVKVQMTCPFTMFISALAPVPDIELSRSSAMTIF